MGLNNHSCLKSKKNKTYILFFMIEKTNIHKHIVMDLEQGEYGVLRHKGRLDVSKFDEP